MIELLIVAGCVLAWRRVRVALQRRSVARLEAAADRELSSVDPEFARELGVFPEWKTAVVRSDDKFVDRHPILAHALGLFPSMIPGVGGIAGAIGGSIGDVHRQSMSLEYLNTGQEAQRHAAAQAQRLADQHLAAMWNDQLPASKVKTRRPRMVS